MKNPLTCLSAEQTTKDQETAPDSLQCKSATPQKKADCQAGPPERKNKRQHIPFVALALVVLFMSLCTLSLLEIHPPALALDDPGANAAPTPASGLCNSVSGQALVECNNCVAHGYTGDTFNLCRQLASEISDPKCKGYEGTALKNCLINDQDLSPSCQNAQSDQEVDTCINNLAIASATATALAPTAEAAPLNQTTSFLISQNDFQLNTDQSSCEHFDSNLLSNGQGSAPASFCWNEDDFDWGNRDITCIVTNTHASGSVYTVTISGVIGDNGKGNLTRNLLKDHTTPVSGSVTTKTVTRNQNTCTDNSLCMSDNAAGNDSADAGGIHDQIGGDNIICSNKSCTTVQTGTTDECGDTNGKQLEYNKFACQPIDGTLRDGGKDKNPASVSDQLKNDREGTQWWDSTGVDINPTAYDPNGALYLPTTMLATKDITPSQTRPECNSAGFWACNTQDGGQTTDENVVIMIEEGNFTKDKKGVIKDAQGNGGLEFLVVPNSHPTPIFWVACDASGGGWAFPCSDPTANTGPYGGGMPFISAENTTQSLDHGQVNAGFIKNDWFSGDYDTNTDNGLAGATSPSGQTVQESGHLEYTYLGDTTNQSGIQQLLPIMYGAGYALMAPIIVLIGYQFLWSSWTLVRAGAMETFGRVLLSVMAMVISSSMVSMLIDVTNAFNIGIVQFHQAHPYPNIVINGMSYTLSLQPQGESDAMSFRGVAVPISRWGCIANDFVALVSNKFWTDAAGYIPFVGGIGKFIGNVFNAIDVAQHIGEFVVLILSITLCAQVLVRIILLNYYVLTAPLAFACWGLPGGVGRGVVRSWAKGIMSLLLVQTVQLFILATFPLILPPFPSLPTDKFGIINTAIAAVPRVLVLVATTQVPKMMGTQATKAIAQAGTVAGGAVVAAAGMAMSTV